MDTQAMEVLFMEESQCSNCGRKIQALAMYYCQGCGNPICPVCNEAYQGQCSQCYADQLPEE